MNPAGRELTMDERRAVRMTQRFEGFSKKIYRDTRGNPTGGWGTHLYTERALPVHVWSELFWEDYFQAERGCDSLRLKLDPVRRAVVVDMIYNMGLTGFLMFVRMREHLAAGNWAGAAREMRDSAWYLQVGWRGPELAWMMDTGRWK